MNQRDDGQGKETPTLEGRVCLHGIIPGKMKSHLKLVTSPSTRKQLGFLLPPTKLSERNHDHPLVNPNWRSSSSQITPRWDDGKMWSTACIPIALVVFPLISKSSPFVLRALSFVYWENIRLPASVICQRLGASLKAARWKLLRREWFFRVFWVPAVVSWLAF